MKAKGIFLSIFCFVVVPICSISLGQCPSSDFTNDCKVDFEDFAVFASEWLGDFEALSVFASQWLYEGTIDDPYDMIWVDINDPGVDEDGDGITEHEPFTGQMSKYETTNAQYCRFLNEAFASADIYVLDGKVYGDNGSKSGEDFVNQVYYNLEGPGFTLDETKTGGAARINYADNAFTVDSGFEDHPVTYVSWYGATAFCNYYGWQLPTQWQWEAVADYDGSYAYGCGGTINDGIANYCDSIHPDGTIAVGTFEACGYGMCDMAGNVWEWTSSDYLSDDFRISRGGSWNNPNSNCEVSCVFISTKRFSHNGLGFRVCR